MALIVEDGSLLEGANAFVTVSEVRAYASARTLSLPDEDSAIESSIIKGTDYIKSLRGRFKGNEIVAEQSLPFPRLYIVVNGFEVSSRIIPQGVKDACCQLTIESAAGADLMPTTNGRTTTREQVGPLVTQYDSNSAPDGSQIFAAAMSLLSPYMIGGDGGSGFGLTSCRV